MRPKVYLAGGFRTNWQKKVIENCGDHIFTFFNPREHGLEKATAMYTTWDLHHVKQADILFGYMEHDNPSGYGLSLEVGFAKALSKTIILVDEKSKRNKKFSRYYGIVRESADIVVENFEEGLEVLRSFQSQQNFVHY